MEVVVNSIELQNFKSFKKETLRLSPLSVLLGPNGSGKTNILEGVKLAFDIAAYRTPVDYPFIPFWGYSNAVNDHDENNTMGFKFDLTIESFHAIYKSKFTGTGGSLHFLEEIIQIENYFELRREGTKFSLKYDEKFWSALKKVDWIAKIISQPSKYQLINHFTKGKTFLETPLFEEDNLLNDSKSIFSINISQSLFTGLSTKQIKSRYGLFMLHPPTVLESPFFKEIGIPIILPVFRQKLSKNNLGFVPFRQSPLSSLFLFFSKFTPSDFVSSQKRRKDTGGVVFIRHDSIYGMKRPVPINYSSWGLFNGESVVIWLFKYFNHFGGKLPERIQLSVNNFFPGWQISFRTTDEGSVILQVVETNQYGKQQIFAPTSLPDGFFKLVLILTAIEMKPGMLLIDELENSLHEKILEHLLDSLRDSGINSILTSHSPLVVNDVDLTEIRILERDSNGSKIKVVEKPIEMKKKLLELGITPSDFWLYGELA